MPNQAIIFGLAGGGALLLTAAVTGSSLAETIQGHANKVSGTSTLDTFLGGIKGGSGLVGPAGAAAATAGSTAPAKVGKVGTGERAFATGFLKTIGAPLNATNIRALEDWWAQEEGPNVLVPGHGGTNNPFEVTTSGSANVPSTGNANSVGVKNYATPQEGIQAAIGYFQTYGPGVLDAFRRGESISNIEAAVRALGPNAFGSDTASPWS